MNRNVIRGALDMLRDVDVLNPERCAQVIDEAVRTVEAELNKEPENNDERPWMNEWQRNMCKKSKAALIHEIEQERAENDRMRKHLAAAGLTVEEVMEVVMEWEQNDRRGCIAQHEEVEALSPENGIGWVLLSDLRTRLTAAIEAKHRKP